LVQDIEIGLFFEGESHEFDIKDGLDCAKIVEVKELSRLEVGFDLVEGGPQVQIPLAQSLDRVALLPLGHLGPPDETPLLRQFVVHCRPVAKHHRHPSVVVANVSND